MNGRLLAALLVGTAFFSGLPVFAPPIVLQADEVPRYLLGLGAALAAGGALFLAAGGASVRKLV